MGTALEGEKVGGGGGLDAQGGREGVEQNVQERRGLFHMHELARRSL